MKKPLKYLFYFFSILLSTIAFTNLTMAQSQLDCSICHSTQNSHWLMSRHANTQNDVADELAEEWAGLPPDSVILGQDAEDCIACHGATSITADSGMTEVQTMEYFFSITNGLYTDSTHALHTDEWPHVACVTCHDVPADHPTSMPTLAIFNSVTAQYDSVANTSILCGQCHGTLRFPDTDHRRLDAWQMSKHGHGGQSDVAGELGEEWLGNTADEVISEEDCIACHAPTSVLMNGKISEADALNLLFTTENGVFTENTVPKNTNLWPEVSCTSCHNQHNPDEISYFNSETKEYEVLSSSQELCGKCHGNLRFPDTDHLSYNIAQGTGGVGVADLQTMPGIKCVDCHMHVGNVDGTNAVMFGGHLWSAFIQEEDGTESTSCTSCHSSINANTAHLIIEGWQQEFANLDSIANNNVAAADSFLTGSSDSTKIHMQQKAQFNLAFAEGDESRGVHNHAYTISLLNDVISKTNYIITGVGDNSNLVIHDFKLFQNYPNPFNPSTQISFSLKEKGRTTLVIFDVLGNEIEKLVDADLTNGTYRYTFDASKYASGIYYYRLSSGSFTSTKKMMLLK